jgi:hypothetical protein
MTSRIDSKVLSNFGATPNHDFWPRPCTYRAFMRSLNDQAPPYQPVSVIRSGAETPDLGKAEREAMEKSSLIYVRNVSANSGSAQAREINDLAPELGLGLATGTRLLARLESSASTGGTNAGPGGDRVQL